MGTYGIIQYTETDTVGTLRTFRSTFKEASRVARELKDREPEITFIVRNLDKDPYAKAPHVVDIEPELPSGMTRDIEWEATRDNEI